VKDDQRPYAQVKIAGETIFGLLDSGTNVSCLGVGALDLLQRAGLKYFKLSTSVRTADGRSQPVLG